jgi:RNA polymerase-binding transcription factor DksA
MTQFDPDVTLQSLSSEYLQRAAALRRDLAREHDHDWAEQAQERQNDDVLRSLLIETEEELRLVGLARQRLAQGSYGECVRCGEPIEPARLRVKPAAECCLSCANRTQ